MKYFEIIEKEFVSLPEVKNILKKIPKDIITYEQKTALEHAEKFSKITQTEARKLFKELKALEMRKLKDELIIQIINIMPKDMDSLKLVLKSSKISFNEEELKKIFDIINK